MSFTRTFLSVVHADVRQHLPDVAPMKAASVTGPSFGQYFVQIRVDGYPPFDASHKAHDAYQARAKAWTDFLNKHISGYQAASASDAAI